MKKTKEKYIITDYQNMVSINASIEDRRKFDIGDIWANEAKCKKCEDIVRSKNRHHFATCKCGAISVDGGSWYAKRMAMDLNDIEEMMVMFKYQPVVMDEKSLPENVDKEDCECGETGCDKCYDGSYCKSCGGCGYVDCDGVRDFLEKHVKGKTDCPFEDSFISDIINIIENGK